MRGGIDDTDYKGFTEHSLAPSEEHPFSTKCKIGSSRRGNMLNDTSTSKSGCLEFLPQLFDKAPLLCQKADDNIFFFFRLKIPVGPPCYFLPSDQRFLFRSNILFTVLPLSALRILLTACPDFIRMQLNPAEPCVRVRGGDSFQRIYTASVRWYTCLYILRADTGVVPASLRGNRSCK